MVYDSYGVMSTDSGSVQADYVSYTGREAERDLGDLGIYYYRARYYDPLTGRFMVPDPLGFAAGDVNLYRYVGNNPANFNDPYGLWSVSLTYHALPGFLPLRTGLGVGGTVTFGSRDGTSFWNVYFGVGYGMGVLFDLDGGPPDYLELNPCLGEAKGAHSGTEFAFGAVIAAYVWNWMPMYHYGWGSRGVDGEWSDHYDIDEWTWGDIAYSPSPRAIGFGWFIGSYYVGGKSWR
jgi:RHS repeat-associated protein